MRSIIFIILAGLLVIASGCMEGFDHGICQHACHKKFGYSIEGRCDVTGHCIDFNRTGNGLDRVCACECVKRSSSVGSVFISETGKQIVVTGVKAEAENGK